MEKHSISVWATYPRHLANTFHLWSISLSTKTSFGILKKCLLSEAWVFTETERNTKWPGPRRATHPFTLTTTTEGQRGVKNLHLIDQILRAGNRFFSSLHYYNIFLISILNLHVDTVILFFQVASNSAHVSRCEMRDWSPSRIRSGSC